MKDVLNRATVHYAVAWGVGRGVGGQDWRRLAAMEIREMLENISRDGEREKVYREQAFDSEARGLATATADRLEVAERFRRRRLVGVRELFVAMVAAARLAMDKAHLSDDEVGTGLENGELVWVATTLAGGK